jgi:Holliday junction resolvase
MWRNKSLVQILWECGFILMRVSANCIKERVGENKKLIPEFSPT